jgi:hypothetical protein
VTVRAPDRVRGAARQVAHIASAEQRHGAAERCGNLADTRAGCGIETHRVRIGADLGQHAVEIQVERVAGVEREAVEITEVHCVDPVPSSASRYSRRHQAMLCARTAASSDCQRSMRSSSGMTMAL